MLFFLLSAILCVLAFFTCYKLLRPYSYWTDKGIRHVRSWPVFGNLGTVLFKKKHLKDISVDMYKTYHSERYVGYMQFTRPFLLIRDPELIRQVGIEEFSHFHDHAPLVESETDVFLSKSLVTIKGEKWRDLRATLSPTFTSSKMRNMHVLIEKCAANFVNHFQAEVEVEMKELFSKFTNDVIATTAFGIEIDSVKEPENEFFRMGMRLSNISTCQMSKALISNVSKTMADLFRLQILPKHVTAFFKTIITNNIRKREEEGIVRPDLIQFLMEASKGKLRREIAKDEKSEGFAAVEEAEADPAVKQIELTDDHIVAQAILFFFGGFDTVSTAATFMSYQLAVNPDIQKKLQEEVDLVKAKSQDKVSYDDLLSMKYLDQVVSETLRMWPPTFQIDRLCVKNFLIQPITPEEKPFLVEKGVGVTIPTMALHRDPQYYPEPHRFDPERFNATNRTKIVPGTYLPFGLGPRNCIGSRFALLEIKTLFYHLLSKFDIVPIEKTQVPLKISKKRLNLTVQNGLWLGLKPRTVKLE